MLLGRPLDLIFDIHTDPGTELDVACVQATGQAGETRIDSSRLRITAQPVIAGRPPSVRIRSSMVVVEPILTLRLTVGCSGAIARTYDFFADVPKEIAARALPLAPLVIAPPATSLAMPPVTPPLALPAPVRAPVAAPTLERPPELLDSAPPEEPPKPAKPPPKAAQPKEKNKNKDKNKDPEPTESPLAPALAPAPLKKPAVAKKDRLKVDHLGDWLAETATAELRLSPSLQQLPQEESSEQRTQAAALWQTLNSAAEYVEQTQARLQQQQAELDAARTSREKLQREVSDLQQRVERLDSERPSSTLMYALLGLLLLVFGLLGWLWQRLRGPVTKPRTEPDWNYPATLHTKEQASTTDLPGLSSDVPPLESVLSRAAAPRTSPDQAAAGAATAAAPIAAPLATEPLDLLLDLPPIVADLAPAAAVSTVRMLHPEELFDLQQQADFFVSVGEHDQAIEVMKKHIADNQNASPLMYLELLRLYHSLSRRDDFKQLRDQFQLHFNAFVPEFAAFHTVGRSLLDYPEAAASIEAVWSVDAVLPLLESYLSCRSDGHSAVAERFDLPAYDDLLLLYAVANTVPASARGAPPPRQRTTPYADAAVVTSTAVAAVAAPVFEVAPEEPLHLPSVALDGAAERDLLSPDSLSSVSMPVAAADMDMDMDMAVDMGLDLDMFLDMQMPVAASAAPQWVPEPSLRQSPSLDNLIEYDSQFALDKGITAGPSTEPAPMAAQPPWILDLDLSEPDFLDLELSPSPENDMPALPATPAPAPGQPIGFGASSDRFEARFDLEDDDLPRNR